MTQGFDARIRTPFAVLGVRAPADTLEEIVYLPPATPALAPRSAIAKRVALQLERYLDDAEYQFELPLALAGSVFQVKVWREIARIAPGKTRSYGDIAAKLGSAPRPVGGACGRNPVPLVVPCHRVLGSAGLGGFMGGRDDFPLSIKRWLLCHEGVLAPAH
ncbi:MAG: methylated-DNA--[protein]-cysteine S-methyltransferase [Betaproteobacteria bacterium]|jgi:methylated-DNA-[protein]-cysteine S-methyltransferase|nr:methylated-DNA--[protein]-cysteine S-methyltransferase [Betaproteobacteria bacterium]